jgi:hypothetical protein
MKDHAAIADAATTQLPIKVVQTDKPEQVGYTVYNWEFNIELAANRAAQAERARVYGLTL